MTIPMRPPTDGPGASALGARRSPARATRPTGPDPLAPLLELPGVRDASDAARTAVDRLLAHRVLRRESAGVSSESALRGARASAALEGVSVPLAAVRSGEVGDPVLQGALRVSVALGSMVETWDRAPGQVLARMHVLAAADLTGPADLGRPGAHAGARLGGVFSLVTVATTAPAVLIAAAVHGELAAVEPFAVGSGVVARAAGRLTGIARGLDPKAISVPEVGFAELGAEQYRTALDGYRAATPDGVAGWLVHCCRATELGAVEGLAICESLLRG